MSQMYGRTPAEILFVEDEYTAYCLNEACAYIRGMMDRKQQPMFKKQYKSFADLYKNIK